MPSPEESARAAELLERLLTDSEFRTRFRRNPAAACEDFELTDLAREFGAGGKSLHTLEIRESRSSLAGAFMAAAAEGAGGVASLRHLHEQGSLSGDAHRVVHQALTSHKLQAVSHDSPLDQTTAGGGAAHEHLVASSAGAHPLSEAAATHTEESAGVADLLSNPHLTLSPDAHTALLAGGADHRTIAVLEELTKSHTIKIGSLQPGQGTDGNSFDILAVDGNPVSASNVPALDLADELGSLGPGLRPEQIITPWPIGGTGYSTGPGYDDRIHVVFGAASVDHSPSPVPAATAPADTAVPPSPADPASTPAAASPRVSVDAASAPAAAGPPSEAASPTAGSSPVAVPLTDSAAQTPPVAVTPSPVEPTPDQDISPAPDVTAAPAATPDVAEPVPAGVSNQSMVIGSVPAGSAAHSTMAFQIPGAQPGAGGSLGVAESVPGAFDPTAAGGLPDTSDAYPGDNASQQAIAAWMGRQAHKAGLPAELPVMAGLVESGLKNDNYGDRDSLGYFQMRTSVWNNGEYAGFANHPELQLKWFLNEALGVRKERLAEGDASYGQDPSKWGDWVADVERPAAEYRGRYQLHLDQAEDLLKQGNAGAASGGGGQMVACALDPAGGVTAPGGSPQGAEALAVAEKYIGTPYKWGGDTPQTGFDCSGLAEYAYGQVGIHLPRVAADQFNVGIPVTKAQLQPGDLVFFRDSTGYIHHVGIYVGNDNFLQAPHTGDVVKISSLDEPYYAQQFAGGRDMSGLATGAGAPVLPGADIALTPGTPSPAEQSQSGVFAALGGSSPPPAVPGSSTVQILPAVTDPSDAGAG